MNGSRSVYNITLNFLSSWLKIKKHMLEERPKQMLKLSNYFMRHSQLENQSKNEVSLKTKDFENRKQRIIIPTSWISMWSDELWKKRRNKRELQESRKDGQQSNHR